jgi:hypothetical protein
MINICAVSIMGTSFEPFLFVERNNGGKKSLKFPKEMLYFGIICLIGNFILDFVQFSNPLVCNTPLALFGMSVASFGLFGFFSFSKIGFSILGLEIIGKNMFIFFLISPVFEWIFVESLAPFISNYSLLVLLVFGILPIVFLYLCAWLLNKKGILFKI